MAAAEPIIRVEKSSDVTTVRFRDRNIIDEGAIHNIGQAILKLIEGAAGPRLVIDFTGVEHLSSAALGALISINNRVRQAEGQLRLCNIDPQIYEVFKITRLNQLFQIHKSPKEALASFKA